jgi:UDP-N-acetylglucosamine 2-epimerase (non-hydrolysing)
VTVTEGTNRLAPWPLTTAGVAASCAAALASRGGAARIPEGWDGNASERIVTALAARLPG